MDLQQFAEVVLERLDWVVASVLFLSGCVLSLHFPRH